MQWVYLGVACFVGLLIVLFFLAPMPEITDADMHAQEGEIGHYDPGPFRKQVNLFLAVWSQFCYVGAQVAVAVGLADFMGMSSHSVERVANKGCCRTTLFRSPWRRGVTRPLRVSVLYWVPMYSAYSC